MNYIQLYQFLVILILLEIRGNVNANEEDNYLFFVKLETKGNLLACAGTILTPCIVLTSAHCVEGGKPSEITVTSVSNVRYEVTAVTVHPGYDSMTLLHDLAMIQTKENFEKPWTGLHVSSAADKILTKCNFFQIATLGDHIIENETAGNLIEKNVRLISNEKCTVLIKNQRGTFQGKGKICGVTTEEDEEESRGCFVNPGGPLMCKNSPQEPANDKAKRSTDVYYWKKNETLADPIDLLESFKKVKRRTQPDMTIFLVGVVSWGKGCSKVPSVYVRTDSYYNWITKTAKRMSRKCAANPDDFRFLTELKSKAGRLLFSETSKFMVFLYIYYISPLVL